MVAVAAADDARRVVAEAPRRRRRRWLLGAAAALAAGVAGFLVVTALAPNPNRQLLSDLPLLEHLDEYRQVDNLDYLRLLAREKRFNEERGEEAPRSRNRWPNAASASPAWASIRKSNSAAGRSSFAAWSRPSKSTSASCSSRSTRIHNPKNSATR